MCSPKTAFFFKTNLHFCQTYCPPKNRRVFLPDRICFLRLTRNFYYPLSYVSSFRRYLRSNLVSIGDRQNISVNFFRTVQREGVSKFCYLIIDDNNNNRYRRTKKSNKDILYVCQCTARSPQLTQSFAVMEEHISL